MVNRRGVILVCVGLAVGFGAVMAARLDASAIAAVLGAACALAFGVPATVIVTALILRYRQAQRETTQRQAPQQPQVLIVPPAQYPYPQLGYRPPWETLDDFDAPQRREFTVIGEDWEELERGSRG